jgi:phosphoribosylglycinamide formyltransferase 1
VRDAIQAGVAQTGASVIIVDNGVDSGPIITQRRVPILPDDTEGELHERIKVVERDLLIQVVRDIATGTVDLKELSRP